MDYPTFDPRDPFQGLLERLVEILRDPDYKPHFLDLLKERVNYEKARVRDLESQTLARLTRSTRTPQKPKTGQQSTVSWSTVNSPSATNSQSHNFSSV